MNAISEKAELVKKQLEEKGISVKYDNRDTHKPGWKFAQYELQGVPLRLALGPRDVENGTIEMARRDTLEKSIVPIEGIDERVASLLHEMQDTIYQKALQYRTENTVEVDTWEAFQAAVEKGGFILAHWDGTTETELLIKEKTKATIRCIPFDVKEEKGKCILTGKTSERRVLFAKSY